MTAVPVADRTRRHVDLVWAIVRRDLALRYRRSVLGIVWAQLGPLALLAILSFVFTRIADLDIPAYPAFLFIGLLQWQWFQSSLVGSAESVIGGRDLVRQPRFPAALLPVSVVAGQLLNLLLALPLLAVTLLVFADGIPWTVVGLPAVLAVQFVVTLPLALVVGALNVRFRDVAHLAGVVLVLLFYVTPVFYGIDDVPDEYRRFFRLNPLTHVIDAARAVALDGQWPNVVPLAVLVAVSAGATVVAMHVFRGAADGFAEEL